MALLIAGSPLSVRRTYMPAMVPLYAGWASSTVYAGPARCIPTKVAVKLPSIMACTTIMSEFCICIESHILMWTCYRWIGIHTVSLADRSAADVFYGHTSASTRKISVQPRTRTSTTYVHGLSGTNQVVAAQLAVHAADRTLTWHVLLIKIDSGFSQPVHPRHFSVSYIRSIH